MGNMLIARGGRRGAPKTKNKASDKVNMPPSSKSSTIAKNG